MACSPPSPSLLSVLLSPLSPYHLSWCPLCPQYYLSVPSIICPDVPSELCTICIGVRVVLAPIMVCQLFFHLSWCSLFALYHVSLCPVGSLCYQPWCPHWSTICPGVQLHLALCPSGLLPALVSVLSVICPVIPSALSYHLSWYNFCSLCHLS